MKRSDPRRHFICLALALGCSRTEPSLYSKGNQPEPPECETASDCLSGNLCELWSCDQGSCQTEGQVECPLRDPCEVGACLPATGACVYRPASTDEDGDGHFSPLPGFLPGQEGACGDDCDDTSAKALPGGVETCDGVDNDCDGVIDNQSFYFADLGDDGIETGLVDVASPSQDGAGRRSVTYGADQFLLSYWARSGSTHTFVRGLFPDGTESIPEQRVTGVNAPSFGADVLFTGATFGAAWSDAREDDNYEIYLARFDANGEKLGPDLRLTSASDFSLHPDLHFDQGRFVAVFDDHRDSFESGVTRIYGQIVSAQGELVGENIPLTGLDVSAEYPALSATMRRYGLVYTTLGDDQVGLEFRSFNKQLEDGSEPLELIGAEARSPSIIALGDNFLVSWERYGNGPGDAIWGALVSEDGQRLIEPQPLTFGATVARSHFALSLGDRFILVWADDTYGNLELSGAVFDLGLVPLEGPVRLTYSDADTAAPAMALSDTGRVGLLFDDWRSGAHRAYFQSFGCYCIPGDSNQSCDPI